MFMRRDWSHTHTVRWYELLSGKASGGVFTSLAYVELCECGAWRVMDFRNEVEAERAHGGAFPGLPRDGVLQSVQAAGA